MKYVFPSIHIVTWLILWARVRVVSCSTVEQSLLRLENVEDVYSLATALPFQREVIFNFDIDFRHYTDHFTLEESIDPAVFSGWLVGGVHLVSGDANQQHNFIVLVRSSSSAEEALDHIIADATSQELHVYTSEDDTDEIQNANVEVLVIVFIRPHSLQFGGYGTTITTNSLNIKLWPRLWFETYHMKLSSLSGSITSSELDTFTAHSIHIETKHGLITGNWSLPADITFITTEGTIDIDLLPKRWSSGPTTGGDVTARSTIGNISIRMPTDPNLLSLRNGTTDVSSLYGSISGTFMHTAVTSIRTQVGHINITLIPYWAFAQWQGVQHNYITTELGMGSMRVDILPAIIDSYYKIQPLCFTNSTHRVDRGYMNLKYPKDWCGRAYGSVSYGGTLEVSGQDFEIIEQDDRHVKLQRPPYGSSMFFEVQGGSAELLMK